MSKRAQYDNVAIDTEGTALDGAEIEVFQADGTTPATIYGSKAGGSTTNPITTGATGLVQFWAEPGEYVLEWHDPEIPARFSDRTTVFEAVSGDSGGIDGGQLEDDAITLARMADDSVDNPQLLDNAVAQANVQDSTVGSPEMASVPAVILVKSGNQSITTGTVTQLTWETETIDVSGMHSGVNSERIIAPVDGVYAVTLSVVFAADNTGRRDIGIIESVGSSAIAEAQNTAPSGSVPTVLNCSSQIKLTASQYLTAQVYHNKGSSLNVVNSAVTEFSSSVSRFTAHWIGKG
jgi:hypothetical protein